MRVARIERELPLRTGTNGDARAHVRAFARNLTGMFKVLLLIVLLGPLIVLAPSLLTQPAIMVAPVTVMFEKLLLLLVEVVPLGELEVVVNNVTVPPSPVLEKLVTMELLLIV